MLASDFLIQLGTSGSFEAPLSGDLYISMNDDYWEDNAGSLSVEIDEQPFTLSATNQAGLFTITVVQGNWYDYTALGTWGWTGEDFVDADGDDSISPADEGFAAPGMIRWSLVARIDGDPNADPNTDPIAVDDGMESTDEETPVFFDVLGNDSDPDGDPLNVDSIDTTSTMGSVTNHGDGTFTYDPNGQFEDLEQGQSATDSFSYTISDGRGGYATATVTITINGVDEPNTDPIAVDDGMESTDEETPVFFDVLGNDSDPDGDPLNVDSIDTTSTMGSVTNHGDGTFTYDPNGQFEHLEEGQSATDSFSYTISDGRGGYSTATVTITINGVDEPNTDPIAVDDGMESTDEETPIFFDVLGNDSDPDGDPLTIDSIDTTSTLGSVTNHGDGTFTYDPNGQFEDLEQGQSTTDSFSYTISDGRGGYATATVTITINGVDEPNQAPVFDESSYSFDVDEDSAEGTYVGTVSATDPDLGDTLTFSGGSSEFEVDSSTGQITIAAGAVLDFETNASYAFDVTVTDSEGLTDTVSVTISLLDENEAPEFEAPDYTFYVDEESAGGTVVGTVTASDPDAGDTLTYSGGNSEFEVDSSGNITIAAGAVLDFETQENYSFDVTITDGGGLSHTVSVSVILNDIEEPNTDPIAAYDYDTTDAATPISVDVFDNDWDPDGDLFWVESIDTTSTLGVVTDNGDGTFTYDPNGAFEDLEEGQSATDSFRYTISDGRGGTSTGIVYIFIDGLAEPNQAPQFDEPDYGFNVDEESAEGTVVGTVSASDPDAGDTLTYSGGSSQFNVDSSTGQITIAAGAMLDFETNASYTFDVTVTDSGGLSDTIEVTVELVDENEAPTDLTLSNSDVDENSPVGTVVGNFESTDPDGGDSHTYSLVVGDGDTDNGLFDIIGSQLVTRELFDHELHDTYSIRVRTTDSSGLDLEKVFAISVNDVNESPLIDNLPDFVRIGYNWTSKTKPVLFIIEATDPDYDDETTFSITGGNEEGMFAIDLETGRVTLEKDVSEAENLFYVLRIEAKDKDGATDEKDLLIRINSTIVGLTGDTQAIEGNTDLIRVKIVRQSEDGDYSQPLTVRFEFVEYSLTREHFADTLGKATLLSGEAVILAGETEVMIELFAPNDNVMSGLKEATLEISDTSDYAKAQGGSDLKESKSKKDAFDLFSWVTLQVLDGVTPFADGTPGSADGSKVDVNDVRQGHVGNCYFHAVLANLAQYNPAFIENAIQEKTDTPELFDYLVTFGDQTITVTLELERGRDAVELSGDYNDQGVEVWTLIMEQAYAQLKGGYANIDEGGGCDEVWELITGESASRENVQGPIFQDTDEQIAEKIRDAWIAGKGVMFGTLQSAPDLPGNHAYSVTKVDTDAAGNVTVVHVYNPWGTEQQITIDRLNENISNLYIGDQP